MSLYPRSQVLLFSLSYLLVIRQDVSAMRFTLDEETLAEGLLNEAGPVKTVSATAIGTKSVEPRKSLQDVAAGSKHESQNIQSSLAKDNSKTMAGSHAEELTASIWNYPLIAEFGGQMEYRIVMLLTLGLLTMACVPMWVFSNWCMESVTNTKAASTSHLTNDMLTTSGKLPQMAGNPKDVKATDNASKAFDVFIRFRRAAKWPCWLSPPCKGDRRVERIKNEAEKLIKCLTLRSFILAVPPRQYNFDDISEGGCSDEEDGQEPFFMTYCAEEEPGAGEVVADDILAAKAVLDAAEWSLPAPAEWSLPAHATKVNQDKIAKLLVR